MGRASGRQNPTRRLISGRDYQIRYALWRLFAMARDARIQEHGLRLRVEAALEDGAGRPFYPDVLIESADGTVRSVIECKEHRHFLLAEDIIAFGKLAKAVKNCPHADEQTQVELVSPVSLLRTQNRLAYQVSQPKERALAVKTLGLDPDELSQDRLVWNVGHRSKTELVADCLFWQLRHGKEEAIRLYLRYYGRLTAQMALRDSTSTDSLDGSYREQLVRDILLDVCRRVDPSLQAELLAVESIDAIELDEVRRDLSAADAGQYMPSQISEQRIRKALRRGLFEDDPVSLDEIYVAQRGHLTMPQSDRRASDFQTDRDATDLLLTWLLAIRQGRIDRLPLLVLGDFGAGKSSLLTWFALTLLQKKINIVPILIPLRDLGGARSRPLGDALSDHVQRVWQVDLHGGKPAPEVLYCLLCDGFDELNVTYLGDSHTAWVRECFGELRHLAERSDVCVIISSRRVLFMDADRPYFEGRDCARLDLELFDEEDVGAWCAKYRRVKTLPDYFDVDFLMARNLFPEVCTPLILYMTARLVDANPQSFAEEREYSRAEIYHQFVDWTCETGGYHRDGIKHRLPRDCRSMLQEVAMFMFQKGAAVVTERRLLSHLRDKYGERPEGIPVDRNLLVAHLFQPGASDDNAADVDAGAPIEFHYQSFREYLVAERVWDTLEPIRRGQELDAHTWMELSGNVYGNAELGFLADTINTIGPAEARNLCKGLDRASSVQGYWTHWFNDVWARLAAAPPSISLDEAKNRLSSHAVRAGYMAALAMVLRLRAFSRFCPTLPENEQAAAVEEADFSLQLVQLLRHLDSLQARGGVRAGRPWDARQTLLQNLEGLWVVPNSQFLNHNLEGIVLRRAVLRSTFFSGSEFHGADVQDCDFTDAVFERCFLWLTLAQGAQFVNARFEYAIIAQERNSETVGGDFTGASFKHAIFRNTAISNARFVKNNWTGARVIADSEDMEPYLEQCTLDAQARSFFESANVVLRDCVIL